MKCYLMTALIGIITIGLITSCKKEKHNPAPVLAATRTIKFILYTDKDFSGNEDNITFSLHIANSNGTFGFDSVVAKMKIKEIPHKANQLVFEHTAPLNTTTLTAGFTYAIENVGNSWYLDTVAANEKFKIIEYPFQ